MYCIQPNVAYIVKTLKRVGKSEYIEKSSVVREVVIVVYYIKIPIVNFHSHVIRKIPWPENI